MDKKDIKPDEITPEETYLNRGAFLKASIWAGTTLATAGIYKFFAGLPAVETKSTPTAVGHDSEKTNSFFEITHYNNYYEFSTDKARVADRAKDFVTTPWQVAVGGLVRKPRIFDLSDLMKIAQEERIYRFRCVEGWSMVIPWRGFPLKQLLDKVEPASRARYVAFETYLDTKQMPDAGDAGIELPYVEGLTLAEAYHPLTLLATGLYGKPLPNQNGAPVRLVVPWKYGFKSIKSVVKITLTEAEPPTTWNKANPREYGFYSNVNPAVDHPRWSQAFERRIGESGTRPTLPFNGYGAEVAQLYAGMDLRKFY